MKMQNQSNSSASICSNDAVLFVGSGMDQEFSSTTFTVDISLNINDVNMYCSYHFGFLFDILIFCWSMIFLGMGCSYCLNQGL